MFKGNDPNVYHLDLASVFKICLIKRSSFFSLCLSSFISPSSFCGSRLHFNYEKRKEKPTIFVEHLFCPRNCTFFINYLGFSVSRGKLYLLLQILFSNYFIHGNLSYSHWLTIIFLLRLSFSRQCVTYFY